MADDGKSKIDRFSNGELSVEITNIYPKDCVWIVQSMLPFVNDSLAELLFLIDAAKRSGAAFVGAVVPYFGYTRQDEVSNHTASPLSVMGACMAHIGLQSLITFTPHNDAYFQKFFPIAVHALDGFLDFPKPFDTDFIIISPDQGGAQRAKEASIRWGMPFLCFQKKRLAHEKCCVHGLNGEVKGHNILLIDDCIHTGETLVQAAMALKNQGAGTIRVHGIHGVFCQNALQRLTRPLIDRITIANTLKHQKLPHSIDEQCVIHLAAQAVKKVTTDITFIKNF
jgi:ribose-phosphate pyrophosphokinase